ncbi:MAG: PQQ-binding-like beta-propeller repeat protein [Opitutae bacterium]|nr:PQQ-binding-like beta-propeller repeat protein [Opitutae bacterium]
MRKMAVILFSLASFPFLLAKDWNQFRGPTGQGHAEWNDLPLKWNRKDSVEWKTELPGKAWSSPIRVSGSLILTNAIEVEGGLALEVLALDSASGKKEWRVTLFEHDDSPRIHKKNSHASPTPFYDGERIFVHFGNLGTACLSTGGQVIWKKSFHYSPVHGSGSSPVVHGDLLLFSADGAKNPCLYALDKKTGEVKWRANRESEAKRKFSFCTPLVISSNGKYQIISPASDYVFSYDLKGNQLWKSHYPGGYSVVPRPICGDEMIYVSSGYDRPTLYAVKVDGEGDVTQTHVVWKTSKAVPHNSSPVLVRDTDGRELFFMAADSGVVSCLDAKSGELRWMERVAGSCSASLLHAGGRIYLTDESGKTFVFKAGIPFKLLAENDLKERTLATPIAVPGGLVIRTENAVWKIGNKEI